MAVTKEEERLKNYVYRRWGPYLAERQWATVREDYSHDGNAWDDFPFSQLMLRAYRWGEDGLAGVLDKHQLMNLSLAMWNGKDDILKERLFGLTNGQGNHGEDVKEKYWYLDNTPSHLYMKYLYKYPINRFPYEQLVEKNAERSRVEHEYELEDTGIFDENEYFDVLFEMAKGDDDPEQLFFRVTAYNRSLKPAPLHLVPHMVLRNTWLWGNFDKNLGQELLASRPYLKQVDDYTIEVKTERYGIRYLSFAPAPGPTEESDDVFPEFLFTENETNMKRLYDQPNAQPYVKDAFHDHIIKNAPDVVNPKHEGTKFGAWFKFDEVPAGDYVTLRYKLEKNQTDVDEFEVDQVFQRRQHEADAFYWRVTPLPIPDELRQVQRQAFAGLLWTKQFYYFVHHFWQEGDPNFPRPAPNRAGGRNKEWKHLFIDDVLSLPDKWEYPFFAAWDTAFHCIPFAMIDPDFAKNQIDLLTREWYMHPNGQIPAYEWNFSDVNPPVHAWLAYRIFKIERKMYGREDFDFLERVFHKLMLNFSWWVNRKDAEGNNVFEGGFLGLDNIGVFNRSEELPTGGHLEQADSTGWMAFFALQMMQIALELAKKRPVYENMAGKFFEHFTIIADALTYNLSKQASLWDETDKFYYDLIRFDDNHTEALPVRSLVGLIPLYALMTLEPEVLKQFPTFTKHLNWFIRTRKGLALRNIALMEEKGAGERILLALVDKDRLVAILDRMLNEDEFLSDYGIRSLSKYHKDHPFVMNVNGQEYKVEYLPGESDLGMFGGNLNWRGPIWFPVNFLLVEALQRFYLYYGADLKVECPKGSGTYLNLAQCAQEIEYRLMHLFMPDENGNRACNGDSKLDNHDPYFKDYVPFYEYFDGDTGRGLGALHQTGWTSLVAKWIQDHGMSCRMPRTPTSSLTRRNSFYLPLDDELKENEQIKQFAPKLGPFPGTLLRRKSGKSLLNLTTHALDMDDEERKHNATSTTQGIAQNVAQLELIKDLVKDDLEELSDKNEEYDDQLIHEIKNAFKSWSCKDENDMSEFDELENRFDRNE